MARFSNIEVPADKQVRISLTYIYGIGRQHAMDILAKAKVDPYKRVKDLTAAEEQKIREVIDNEYVTEGDLRRRVVGNIKRLRDIKSYRGERHTKNLPARGQRTRTNARTKRGKRIAIGGAQPKAASKT
ncbi:MAG: 30S ribosomal protein S13 [Candidatus Nomurabacteria bacterium]|jgi:small subunit ribosomal protein S13|nr:30S ribosomal protein S13 [Candidatus Nomurabacteria bacterium]